jgi:N6-adenosine-specific RNA methylase IME4
MNVRTETVLTGVWHPFAALFELIPPGKAYDAMRDDIAANGVREPVVVYDGKILDGRNRYLMARDLKLSFPVRDFEGDDAAALAFVLSTNLHRRHLTEAQRASVGAKIANMARGNPSFNSANLQNSEAKVSVAEAAQMLNVSPRSIETAKTVHRDGAPELVQAMDAGRVSVSAAADVATLPKAEQAEIVAKGEAEILAAAKDIRARKSAVKRQARDQKLTELSSRNADLPASRTYPVIYADPPWQYDFSPSSGRAVENHYPTMPIEEIFTLPVADLATPDAVLFLWAPPSFIKKGIATLEAWGFELASSMVWDKEKIGTGIYFRQQHEYLLLGKRGNPITPAPGTQPRSVYREERGKHSAKPVGFYDLIERMYPGLPKIELFSRAPREGWDAWGNQAHAA